MYPLMFLKSSKSYEEDWSVLVKGKNPNSRSVTSYFVNTIGTLIILWNILKFS